MAGNPERVHKQRAAEVAEAEALAHRAAVDREQRARLAQALPPACQRCALRVKQMQVHFRPGRAVQPPVIGGRDAGVQRAGSVTRDVPQQRVVGRKVERTEITPFVGQHIGRQPHGVQREHLDARGDQVMQRGELRLPVKGQHEQRFSLHRADLIDGRGRQAAI